MNFDLVQEALDQLSSESNQILQVMRTNPNARQIFRGLDGLEADLRGDPELLLQALKYSAQVHEERIRELERRIRKGL